MESWSELDTLAVPQIEAPAVQESSSSATWSGNNIQNADQWAIMNAAPSNQSEMETWQEPQALDEEFDPAILEQHHGTRLSKINSQCLQRQPTRGII
jgi:hypothetical protein